MRMAGKKGFLCRAELRLAKWQFFVAPEQEASRCGVFIKRSGRLSLLYLTDPKSF